MQYLDTSVLVCAYTTEPKTAGIQAWLSQQPPAELAISDWVAAEFSAALSLKLRTGHLDQETRADALALFARFCADTATILPVAALHFRLAARFADQHALGLRAPDALHLAICADQGVTIATLDRQMSDAAAVLGIAWVLL